MTASDRPAPRLRAWVLVVVAAALIAAGALAIWRPWNPVTPPVARGTQAVAAAVAPQPLALPAQPRVLVFGDSWTYGSAASDPTLGYAYRIASSLGWDATVDGVRGSGYLKQGLDGGTFGERIATLDPALDPDLVIVEGSINDRRLGAEGYREAVSAAWDALAALYPDARIVVMGPAPQVLPVEEATARIDADLRELAGGRGWWYVSPIADDWITSANYLDVIDTSTLGNDHPSDAGHAYLAERLAEALAGMTSVEVAAGKPEPAPGA